VRLPVDPDRADVVFPVKLLRAAEIVTGAAVFIVQRFRYSSSTLADRCFLSWLFLLPFPSLPGTRYG
jgi:hypothetical protein